MEHELVARASAEGLRRVPTLTPLTANLPHQLHIGRQPFTTFFFGIPVAERAYTNTNGPIHFFRSAVFRWI